MACGDELINRQDQISIKIEASGISLNLGFQFHPFIQLTADAVLVNGNAVIAEILESVSGIAEVLAAMRIADRIIYYRDRISRPDIEGIKAAVIFIDAKGNADESPGIVRRIRK